MTIRSIRKEKISNQKQKLIRQRGLLLSTAILGEHIPWAIDAFLRVEG